MENRLNLLCEAGVIDKDICSGMLQVVERLDEEWRLPIHSEQGTMAMTHMASALMRSRRGEVIEALDGGVAGEELAQSHLWPTILLVHQALMKEFTVALHANEGYMLANLYGLWMAANEGV